MGRIKELLIKREEAYANGDMDEFKRLDEIIEKVNNSSKNSFLSKEDISLRLKYNKKNLKRFAEKEYERRHDIEKDL